MSLIDLKVPTVGESITEVTLSKWLKANGEFVNIDDAICEFESDKATLEFPAEASGTLSWVASEGDDLKIGALVARIDTSGQVGSVALPKTEEAVVATSSSAETIPATDKPIGNYAAGTPSPAAAKIMAENNIKADEIDATGKDGRITKQDVVNKLDKSPSSKLELTPITSSSIETINPVAFSRVDRVEKMSRMRRTIATRLVSAKNNTAMLTTFNEVDMTGMIALRAKYQDRFVEKFGIKLGFMSLFSKACASVLMEMPEVNAKLDGENIVYHDYADISIAISTPTGLVVPPVKNVESLSLAEIEKQIKVLAEKARNGKLTLEEMSGGTFTITNGGVFGSMMSTPIINEPQSAILGMHAMIDRPVVIEGQIVIRSMMYVAMSYDHRVIDGSSSVTFLVKVKKLLEDPTTLLLGL